MEKFVNVKTQEVKEFELDKDIFYNPYLKRDVKDGRVVGHCHQDAYFDNEGNEYRRSQNLIISGTKLKEVPNYTSTKSSNWVTSIIMIYKTKK